MSYLLTDTQARTHRWNLGLAMKCVRVFFGGPEFSCSVYVSSSSALQVGGMCGQAPQRASRSVEPPPLHQPPAAPVARDAPPSDSDETLAGLRR